MECCRQFVQNGDFLFYEFYSGRGHRLQFDASEGPSYPLELDDKRFITPASSLLERPISPSDSVSEETLSTHSDDSFTDDEDDWQKSNGLAEIVIPMILKILDDQKKASQFENQEGKIRMASGEGGGQPNQPEAPQEAENPEDVDMEEGDENSEEVEPPSPPSIHLREFSVLFNQPVVPNAGVDDMAQQFQFFQSMHANDPNVRIDRDRHNIYLLPKPPANPALDVPAIVTIPIPRLPEADQGVRGEGQQASTSRRPDPDNVRAAEQEPVVGRQVAEVVNQEKKATDTDTDSPCSKRRS